MWPFKKACKADDSIRLVRCSTCTHMIQPRDATSIETWEYEIIDPYSYNTRWRLVPGQKPHYCGLCKPAYDAILYNVGPRRGTMLYSNLPDAQYFKRKTVPYLRSPIVPSSANVTFLEEVNQDGTPCGEIPFIDRSKRRRSCKSVDGLD